MELAQALLQNNQCHEAWEVTLGVLNGQDTAAPGTHAHVMKPKYQHLLSVILSPSGRSGRSREIQSSLCHEHGVSAKLVLA